MLIVRGTHTGVVYDLAFCDTEIEALAVKRREQANNHYQDVHVFDHTAWQHEQYRELDPDELRRLSHLGDPVAREVLTESLPAEGKQPTKLGAKTKAGD